jgi:outer membrane lipopolysaccharide assembly protein LptE/RlpB
MNKFLYMAMVLFCGSCDSVNYGMLDGSIDAETFSVEIFEEQASNAPPGYGATYTDFLKDYMISRTKLNLKDDEADIEISGKIIQYNTSPVSVQTNEVAALNRLTVTLSVTVINNVKEEDGFETNFRQFSDYDASQDLATVEDALLQDINDKLSQDIINRLTSNW